MKIEIEPGTNLYIEIELNRLKQNSLIKTKPVLILIHGGPGSDHNSFKPFFSQLSDIVQIIYYDHRGHGRSENKTNTELTLDILADDIVKLCNVLEIDNPIILGQSFGGFVAQKYISMYPAHPQKVILSSTSPKFNLDRKLKMFEILGGKEARNIAENFWTNPNNQTYRNYKEICKPLYSVKGNNKNSKIISNINENILFKWTKTEHLTMNLLPGLKLAQCPVLVIAGELDPVCPLNDSQDIVSALPQHLVHFEQFKNCGHGVWRDNQDKAFKIIRQFILE